MQREFATLLGSNKRSIDSSTILHTFHGQMEPNVSNSKDHLATDTQDEVKLPSLSRLISEAYRSEYRMQRGAVTHRLRNPEIPRPHSHRSTFAKTSFPPLCIRELCFDRRRWEPITGRQNSDWLRNCRDPRGNQSTGRKFPTNFSKNACQLFRANSRTCKARRSESRARSRRISSS